jgi:chromosome segregation ATPase
MFTIYEEVKEYLWRADCQNPDLTVDPVNLLRDIIKMEDRYAKTLLSENGTLQERVKQLEENLAAMTEDRDLYAQRASDYEIENTQLKEDLQELRDRIASPTHHE